MKEQTTFRVRENSWIAALAARKLRVPSVALTLGNTIHLHRTSKEVFLTDQRWVRHELAHIAQFRRYGFWTFIWLYLIESLNSGYFMNRFEVEARAAEIEQIEQIEQIKQIEIE